MNSTRVLDLKCNYTDELQGMRRGWEAGRSGAVRFKCCYQEQGRLKFKKAKLLLAWSTVDLSQCLKELLKMPGAWIW